MKAFSVRIGKIKAIIASRVLIYTNKHKAFVMYRGNICDGCPFNSKNKEKDKTIKGYLTRFINSYKEYCTACGCGIDYKISVPESICGLYDIGEEPKWIEHYED